MSQAEPGCRSSPAAGSMLVGDAVRWVAAAQDFELPAVPFPSRRVFYDAGEASLRTLVRRHHDNLRRSSIRGLFPADDTEFDLLVRKVTDYVVEACGGPDRFTPRHGNTCMRTRHFPFTIDENARETWLVCLWDAFDQVSFPDAPRQELWNWLEAFSVRMINRRTTRSQPPRFPYAEMSARRETGP